MGSFVCDNCMSEFKMDDFGIVNNKCPKCGSELRYDGPENNSIIKNRALKAFIAIGSGIFIVCLLASIQTGIILLILALICLFIGKYIDNNYESVITDKIRRFSIVVFVPSFLLFILFFMVIKVPLNIIIIDIFILILSVSLFTGLSLRELSKSDTGRISYKLDLKIDELKNEKINGLGLVLKELEDIKSDDIYLKLIDCDLGLPFEDRAKNRMIILADKIMKEDIVGSAAPSLKGNIVGFMDFRSLYVFLENIYTVYKGEKLSDEDYKNIYFSGLDEQIALSVKNFDNDNVFSKPTVEFFEKIFNIKWDDNESKTFLEKFEGLRNYYMIKYYDNHYDFVTEENRLIKFLTACSAYSRNKSRVKNEDVINAHITYFKLLKTDLTQYKAKKELLKLGGELLENQSKGYLVCNKCGGYYELEPGESPEDFINNCECGGELEYKINV